MSSAVRVIVATGGTVGDVLPFLPLAAALQDSGLDVALHGPVVHAAAVVRAGLRFVGLASEAEYRAAIDDPALWHPRHGFGVVWRATERAMAGFLQDLLQLPTSPGGEPIVVLAHPLAVPVCAIAQALRSDLRLVACYLAPSNLKSVHHPLVLGPVRVPRGAPAFVRRGLWAMTERFLLDPPTLPLVNGLRAAHGLPPVRHFVQHLMAAPQLSITLFPPWFAAPQPDWPRPLESAGFLYGRLAPGQALPGEAEALLGAGLPPLVATFGSGQRFAAPLFDVVIEAARRLQRGALLLCARDQLPAALPPHVAWSPWLPLDQVLPRAAVLLHHGGIGTAAEALRAGTRQLVLPQAFDQFDNAARVEALGVGLRLSPGRLRPATLAASLQRLLSSDAVADACRRIAAQAAQDGNGALGDAVTAVRALAGLPAASAADGPART